MPHSPGCPGHSHTRRCEQPCPAYQAERRRRLRENYVAGVCEGCGRSMWVEYRNGKPYCKTCMGKWRADGFTSNGPPPLEMRPTALELALENQHLLTSRWTVKAIARELGYSERTVNRWRALLRRCPPEGETA